MCSNIRLVVLAVPQAKMNSLRFPSPGKICCAYVAAFEAAAKQKFKLHFYFLDTL